MKSVYYILDEIRDHLRANGITNTVSFGDLAEIDTNKTTIFPLVHLDVEAATQRDNVIEFRILILSMGIVDQDYAEEAIDEFFGGNNLHDVYNEQLYVLTNLVEALRRGSLWDEQIRVEGDPEFTPFEKRFDNQLAGWGGTITLNLPNNVSIC
jgi:hypothetical protein